MNMADRLMQERKKKAEVKEFTNAARQTASGRFFESKTFGDLKKRTLQTLSELPYREEPQGWGPRARISVGKIAYVGFGSESRYLLIVGFAGRSVFDLETRGRVDKAPWGNGKWLDEQKLLCKGIGPLEGQTVRIAGIGGGGLPQQTKDGHVLYPVSPSYPCIDIVHQPPFPTRVRAEHAGCALIYNGFVMLCGFSYDGRVMLVVDDDVTFWHRAAESTYQDTEAFGLEVHTHATTPKPKPTHGRHRTLAVSFGKP